MTRSLTRLVYRSRSLLAGTKSDRLAQAEAILERARPKNLAAGLTGMLHFDGTSFMQTIEGSADGVERLYEAIACDSRHEKLTILELRTVEEREHPDWSMAFVAAIPVEDEDPAIGEALAPRHEALPQQRHRDQPECGSATL
jgi:hypothetical protein